MGYFANLYLVEARATADAIEVSTSVFGAEIGPVAYFSWGARGDDPNRYLKEWES